MKIRLKHKETEIEMEFTSGVTKDKFDVMRIITHIISEFQYILNNTKEAINENGDATNVQRVDDSRVHDTNDIDT